MNKRLNPSKSFMSDFLLLVFGWFFFCFGWFDWVGLFFGFGWI